jgi:bacterioferritin-associated ferredoxin
VTHSEPWIAALLDSNRAGALPMAKRARKLTCEEFQRHIAEQRSGADLEELERNPHAKSCAACRRALRQLLRELGIIEEAAHSLSQTN